MQKGRLAKFAVSPSLSVDREKGVIRNVSVVTVGEAEGHGIWIDDKTLNTVLLAAAKSPSGFRVPADHDGGVLDTLGYVRDFRRDGDQIRADFYLLEADPLARAKVLEMAERMPEMFGLSLTHYYTTESIGGKKFARVDDIQDVALVTTPAANPALFSAITQTKFSDMEIEDIIKAAIAAAVSPISDEMSKLSARLGAIEGKEYEKPMAEMSAKIGELSAKLDGVQKAAIDTVAARLGVKDAGASAWSVAPTAPQGAAPEFPKVKAVFAAHKAKGASDSVAAMHAARSEPVEWSAFLKTHKGDLSKLA